MTACDDAFYALIYLAVLAAKNDINMKQVRFHGVLDDDMSTYLDGHANMFNVFSTYDFLQSIGMRPYVEVRSCNTHPI